MAIFKGAGVAIVTPMKNNEEVNYDKLEELINQQIDGGTDAIVIAGTTGESATLTMEEHRDVIKAAIEFTKHRVPVVAGTGSNCTRTAIQLSQEAEEAGADGLLVVTPYYNKATQAGLISHYSQIADNTKCHDHQKCGNKHINTLCLIAFAQKLADAHTAHNGPSGFI